MRANDLANKKFGRLLALFPLQKRTKNGQIRWRCICDCGKKHSATGTKLVAGTIKSCGCGRNLPKRKSGPIVFWNGIWNIYFQSAKKRNLEFNLTIEQLQKICSKNCFYCDIEPKENMNIYNSVKNRGLKRNNFIDEAYIGTFIQKSNGIDRVDNTLGYGISNCVPCCANCNTMKMALDKKEFFSHIQKIYNHSIKDR